MMTFSQQLADRVRDIALSQWGFNESADAILAAVFHDTVGQYADLWIEAEREEVRKSEEATK